MKPNWKAAIVIAIFAIVLFFLAVKNSQGEEFNLTSFEFFSGKSSLFSGTDFLARFEDEGAIIKLQGNETRVNIQYLWKLPRAFSAGITGGYFENDPWLGPEFAFNPKSYFSTFHWAGGILVKEKIRVLIRQSYFLYIMLCI